MFNSHDHSATILWCLVYMLTITHVFGNIVTVNNPPERRPQEKLEPKLTNQPTPPKAAADDKQPSNKILHRDLLELYQKVLSELLRRDRLKRKLEQIEFRLEGLDDLFNRVDGLEDKMHAVLRTGADDAHVQNNELDRPSPHHERIQQPSPSSDSKLDDQDPPPPGLRNSDVDRRDVSQVDSTSRHEHFLPIVAATLQEHTQQIDDLQSCNTMHGELLEDQASQLEVLDTQLGIHNARIEKLKVDGHWHQFKFEAMENFTRTLRNKVHEFDKAIEGIYSDHGNIYRRLDSLGVNSSQCGNMCGELGARISVLEKMQSSKQDSQIREQQVVELKAESAPRTSSFGVSHHTYNALMAMNDTQRTLLQNYDVLSQSLEAMSVDARSNKADISNLHQQLELLYDQMDKLRESDDRKIKQQRRIQKRLRDLEQEVTGLSGTSLGVNAPRVVSTPTIPTKSLTPPLMTMTELPVRRTSSQRTSSHRTSSTTAEDKIVITPPTASRGSGLKREVDQYFITPPSRPLTTEDKDRETIPTKVHSFLSYDSSDTDKSSQRLDVLVQGQDREGVRYMTAVVTNILDPRVSLHEVHNLPHQACQLQSIGAPVTVHEVPKTVSGWWRRDTWEGNKDSIYVFLDTYKAKHLYEYKSLSALKNNTPSVVHHLPFSCSGSGHVVYHRNLFCNRFATNRIMKYDLMSKTAKSRRVLDAGYHNLYPYSFGGASDIDVAVDEMGMWVVYGSRRHQGNITIAKLNPDTLREEQKWHTPFQKNVTGNTFMFCGRLYVVEYHEDSATVANVYDTFSGTILDDLPQGGLDLGGEQGAYRTMLDYNPHDSTLYAWHMSSNWNGQLVTYDVVKTMEEQ